MLVLVVVAPVVLFALLMMSVWLDERMNPSDQPDLDTEAARLFESVRLADAAEPGRASRELTNAR